MSGRIGDLKTAGSGCVDPLGVPSALAIVTVGRVVIFAVLFDMLSVKSALQYRSRWVDLYRQGLNPYLPPTMR